MKTKRRRELHTNVLADWIGERLEKVRPYLGWIAVGVASVVLMVLVISYFRSHSESQLENGWSLLNTGVNSAYGALQRPDNFAFKIATDQIEQIGRDYPDTSLSLFANIWLGDIYLTRGQLLMNSDRAAALESFKRAVTYYGNAAAAAKDPLVKNRALFKMGTSQEWMFQTDEARATYQSIEGPLKEDAQQRLDDLANGDTRLLYDRLQKTLPRPPALPASRPSENLSKPEDSPLKRLGEPATDTDSSGGSLPELHNLPLIGGKGKTTGGKPEAEGAGKDAVDHGKDAKPKPPAPTRPEAAQPAPSKPLEPAAPPTPTKPAGSAEPVPPKAGEKVPASRP